MSMESQTESAPRRIPIQERGEKRVAELMQAAAAIFAEVGFEAATAHGRAALDQSRRRYQRVAPTTARGIISYAEASDVPDQGASLRGNYSPNGEGIVVALCRHRACRARSARRRDKVCAGELSVAAPEIVNSCAARARSEVT